MIAQALIAGHHPNKLNHTSTDAGTDAATGASTDREAPPDQSHQLPLLPTRSPLVVRCPERKPSLNNPSKPRATKKIKSRWRTQMLDTKFLGKMLFTCEKDPVVPGYCAA